jgi:hypothetical protein
MRCEGWSAYQQLTREPPKVKWATEICPRLMNGLKAFKPSLARNCKTFWRYGLALNNPALALPTT